MDLEANQAMLTPLMCEACILRRKKKNSRRIIARCCFVAYNILVLLVLSVTLWYINDRLHDTEKNVAVLQEQSKMQNEKHPADTSSLAMTTDAEEKQAENDQIVNLVETVGGEADSAVRTKRGTKQKRKSKKRCKNCLPVVQIEGSGGLGKTDKSDLSYLWKIPTWVSPKDKAISKYFDVSSVTREGRIKVKEGGLYILYAQMTLTGKSKRGYHIKKEPQKMTIATCANYSNVEDKTGSASLDNATFIMRPCATMTVLRLEKNDKVYIEEMEENSKALYNSLSAVFGLIKIGT